MYYPFAKSGDKDSASRMQRARSLLRRSLFSQRFLKKRCKGTTFYAYSQINCTKSTEMCTERSICAIYLLYI